MGNLYLHLPLKLAMSLELLFFCCCCCFFKTLKAGGRFFRFREG